MLETVLAWSPARKLITSAVGALFLMALGAAAWDRTPIIGPHAKIERLRADIGKPITGYRARLAAADAYGANREDARRNCESARSGEAAHSAGTVTDTAQRNSLSATQAFNHGFAAGKVAGRSSCPQGTPTHAPRSVDSVPGPPDGVRVGPDLATEFNAAVYVPGGPLPR